MDDAILKRKRIVFVDEALYTNNTWQTTEWSRKRKNVQLEKGLIKHKPVWQLVAASAEKGLEASIIQDDCFNSKTFCSVLREVQTKGPSFVIFGDGASYHLSKYAQD